MLSYRELWFSLKVKFEQCITSVSVKEKLRHDPDSEIATTSLRVSLMCPVSILLVAK